MLVLKCHCLICKLRQKLLKRQLFEARSAVICQLMNLTNDTVGRSFFFFFFFYGLRRSLDRTR